MQTNHVYVYIFMFMCNKGVTLHVFINYMYIHYICDIVWRMCWHNVSRTGKEMYNVHPASFVKKLYRTKYSEPVSSSSSVVNGEILGKKLF